MLHIIGAAKCLASYVELKQGLDVLESLKSEVVHVATGCVFTLLHYIFNAMNAQQVNAMIIV